MAPRNKHYLTLALCVNCFVFIVLILDSKLLSTKDVNIGLLPATWDAPWSKSSKAETEFSMDGRPDKRHCSMCSANSTLCQELGSVSSLRAWENVDVQRAKAETGYLE
jgi:hypothetical protein